MFRADPLARHDSVPATTCSELAERTRLEGLSDALIWSSAAVASLGSGLLVAFAGSAALGVIGLGLVLIPTALVLTRRSSLPSPQPA